MNMKFCLLFLILSLVLYSIVQGEYTIKDGDVPSYFYKIFEDVKEDIFPYDLRIKLSLSRITGTLFYSMDKNNNQLIVTLRDVLIPIIDIEFNTQSLYIDIPKLCGCDKCRYQILDLRIQMRNSIHIQCNDRDVRVMKYERSEHLNEVYPIPYNRSGKIANSLNEAHLWLVNTPQYGEVYPNSNQLSGCIFSMLYNNNPIVFTNITKNIETKCKAICSENICNGGQCYETYNSGPVCNCTKTFLNGIYCNDTNRLGSLKSNAAQSFIFDMFKLSWNSSFSQIMKLYNKKISIRLFSENKNLIMEYRYTNPMETLTRAVLMTNYSASTENILIVYFMEARLDMVLSNFDSQYYTFIATNQDLRREIYKTLELQSEPHGIEFVYKTSPHEYRWRKLDIVNPQSIDERNQTTESQKFCTRIDQGKPKEDPISGQFHYIILFGVTASLLCLETGFFIKILCRQQHRYKSVNRLTNV